MESAAASLDSTRREWEEGHRRLEALARDQALYHSLVRQLETVIDELRRRVGETFTLDELVVAYGEADRWSREVLEERGEPGVHRHTVMLEDAAFHRYSRGAVDYKP
ncbi:MAG: hypothetical protein ABR583_00475 [Gaiellaceae bacterium]